MKTLITIVVLLICLSCSSKKKDKRENESNATQKTYEPSSNKIGDILTSGDSLKILTLTRQLYQWEDTLRCAFFSNIGKVTDNQKTITEVDWEQFNKNVEILLKSGFFSYNFISSYKQVVEKIEHKLKNNLYEYKWFSDDPPPYWSGANIWCYCQDTPFDEYWNYIEISNIKISENTVSLNWNWGKGVEWEWLQGDKKGYLIKVEKVNGEWKILYIDGFDTRHY